MGRQIWQMQIDHQQEQEKLKRDYEKRIEELREDLTDKENKLCESRQQAESLVKMQTEHEQEKQKLNSDNYKILSELRAELMKREISLSDSRRRTEQLEAHVKKLEGRLQGLPDAEYVNGDTTQGKLNSVDSRFGFLRGVCGFALPIDSFEVFCPPETNVVCCVCTCPGTVERPTHIRSLLGCGAPSSHLFLSFVNVQCSQRAG